MSDLFGVQAIGGGIPLRQATDQPVPSVPKVAEATKDGDASYNQGAHLPGQNGETLEKSKATQEQSGAYAPWAPRGSTSARDAYDPHMLAGPTPSFQASVLEVESDMRTIIAQVEAKRAIQQDEFAIAPIALPQAADGPDTATGSQEIANPRPTEQRNDRPDTPQLSKAEAETPEPQVAPAQSSVPVETQDREAAYAGPAATLETPYSRSSDPLNDLA